MFLFHWCMNALRCRRDLDLETLPLSPTKYNGLPPALDCGLQRPLVDDIPASCHDVSGIRRLILDEDDPANRLNTAFCPRVDNDVHQSATAPHTCHSESYNSVGVLSGGCFHPDYVDESMASWLSSTASNEDITFTADGINGHDCACDAVVSVSANTGHVTYNSDVISKSSVPSFTDFCMSSSQSLQPHLNPGVQHGIHSAHKASSLITDNDLPRNTHDADYIDFISRNSPTDVCVLDTSHRKPVASSSVDSFQDPLVTAAILLVNSAVNSAVEILDIDATWTSKTNPINDTILLPISNTSNCVPLLPSSDKTIQELDDSVETAASRLVNQVLSQVLRRNNTSVFVEAETPPGETSLTTATCAAQCQYFSFPYSRCESDGKLTADVESSAAANAGCILMPAAAAAAAGGYLSESNTGSSSVDHPHVSAAHEPVCMPNCDYNSAYALYNAFESMTSQSGGRRTFISEEWRPVSPPLTDSFSPDDVSAAVNDNNVVVELFDDTVDVQSVYNDLNTYLHHIDDETRSATMCSEIAAERDVDLSRNSHADDTTESCIHHCECDDNYAGVRQHLKQHISDNMAAGTCNSCESRCRPEDYFFHRYVIPIDQLDSDEVTSAATSDLLSDVTAAQNDRGEQRSRMQLDLKADEHNSGTNIDAEIEAVAAFCRAMFTPVDTETDDNDDEMSPFDIVGSPDEPCIRDGRPLVVRHCISLRTSPGTPHKKKSVRFADALGLDLENIRQIQTDDDLFSAVSIDDIAGRPRRPLLAEASAAWHRSRPAVRRYLCACFQAPGSRPDFIDRVRQSRVVLENCETDDRLLTISGVIRVANVTYHKTVAVRVTTDGWTTQTDVTAEYVPRSNDGTTDRFSFQIVLPCGTTALGRRVEFAVYFVAVFDLDNRSETYWDNNFGANYCFECYARDDGEAMTLDMDKDDGQLSTWLRFV